MKRFIKTVIFLCFILFSALGLGICVFADEDTPKTIGELQAQRSRARLFLPNFVIIGENATFKIVTKPFYNIELRLEYDDLSEETYTSKASDMGLGVFNISIPNNKNYVGQSVLVEAYVWHEGEEKNKSKALPQDNNKIGHSTLFDRVYITDNDNAKGILVSPSKILNEYIMNNNIGEDSNNYNPYNNPYSKDTPIYVKNMRDARDNVRQVRQTINNSGRQYTGQL